MNVVLILADDLGARDLGAQGSAFHDTPWLDALARSGMQFTQAYAACPVCSPTRASLLTGKYPARLRITDWIPGRAQWPTAKLLTPSFEQQLPLAETTLAEALQKAGYVTASIGKWHLGGNGFLPTDQGFSLNAAGTEKGSPPSYFAPYKIPGLEAGEGQYLTDTLASLAEKFIDENKDKPFFLYLPFFAVHTPLQGKKELVEKYTDRAVALTAQSNPIYAAMLESLDAAVGRVILKLETLKLHNDTAIIFLSDNGGLRFEGRSKEPVTNNAPLRAGKGHLYEGGIRIPFIIRWPGGNHAGSRSRAPVSTIDVMPTILDLLGIKGPAMDGVSLAPVMRGGFALARPAIYWHYPHYSNQGGVPSGAIRRGDWKLIEFYEDGRLELFDLASDQSEHRNLVKREPQLTQELHNMLKAWRASVGAVMPKSNPAYDAVEAGQGLTGVEPPTSN